MRRITTTLAEAAACAAVGAVAALGVVYTFDHDQSIPNPQSLERPTPSPVTFGSPLSAEEIDVLTEGDDWDHPWEECRINSDLWVFCPDGSRIQYPAPLDDGSVTVEHAFDDAADLEPCDVSPDFPCRSTADPTYVVGGDGNRHEQCVIVLLSAEDSEAVCADDTVWAS